MIGRAVKLASRTEGLCRKLGRRTLVSDTFRDLVAANLQPVGAFELKGFAGERQIFALLEPAPTHEG